MQCRQKKAKESWGSKRDSLKVVNTCPLSSPSDSVLTPPTPLAANLVPPSPFLARRNSTLRKFLRTARSPTIQASQESEDASWVVVNWPADQGWVLKKPQKTSEKRCSHEIELADVSSSSSFGSGEEDSSWLEIAKRISARLWQSGDVVRTESIGPSAPDHRNVGRGKPPKPNGSMKSVRSCNGRHTSLSCVSGELPLAISLEEDLVFPDQEDLIDRGAFGDVVKATFRGFPVAVKRIHPLLATEERIRSIQNELDVLLKVGVHENVVACLGGKMTPPCFIIEELMESDLDKLIHPNGAGLSEDKDPKPLSLEQTLRVGLDIARGLNHLHPKFLHRDLKPGNVLMKNGVAKIADFGLSKAKINSYLSNKSGLKGTVPYMSPESMLGKINHKVDIFSLGILLWECVTGLRPYLENPEPFCIIFNVKEGRRPQFPKNCDVPISLRKLIESCWDHKPRRRPDSHQVIRQLENIWEQSFGPGKIRS